jgi:hypothetical protein
MSRKPFSNPHPSELSPKTSDAVRSPQLQEAELRKKIEDLLEKKDVNKALELINHSRIQSATLTSARAVCMLRLGKAREVVAMLRPHVIMDLHVRKETPTAFKINFATALLLDGNVSGCVRLLGEMNEEDHPEVQKLRAAIRQWEKRLPLWRRLCWYLGDDPSTPVTLDFEPGTL